MSDATKHTQGVSFLHVSEKDAGQRLDNFLRKHYPQLPKSRRYQMVRKGEVRVNKKRVKVLDKLQAGDVVRIPPLYFEVQKEKIIPEFFKRAVAEGVLYEDEDFLIINKPAGLAVHAGSAQDFGLIDVIDALWGKHYAELGHRLDKDTSGAIVLGKNHQALQAFFTLIQEDKVDKRYFALVQGTWNLPRIECYLEKGEVDRRDMVRVVEKGRGKYALTLFQIRQQFAHLTLIEAQLKTGRTHQIRVSCASAGHPIVGDDRYGDRRLNQRCKERFGQGMFLHAKRIAFSYQGKEICAHAPPPAFWAQALLLADEI